MGIKNLDENTLSKLSECKTKEEAKEVDSILVSRQNNVAQAEESSDGGRPEKDETKRNSDPDDAERSKNPKPSNPDGSMPDDSG